MELGVLNSYLVRVTKLFSVVTAHYSGIARKKTKSFAGDPAPFVMELPAHHAPS